MSAQPAALKPEDFVVRENDALIVDAPKLVAAGVVAQAEWAPSGKHVLAWRDETDLRATLAGQARREAALVLWTRETRKQRELWKTTHPQAGIDEVHWLPGSDSALAVIRRPMLPVKGAPPPAEPAVERWLLLVDARQGVSRALTRLPDGAMVMASSRRPFAVIQSLSPRLLAVVRADGGIRDLSAPALKMPPGFGWWTPDGSALRFNGPGIAKGAAERRPSVFLLDPATTKVTGPFSAAVDRAMAVSAQPTAAAPSLKLKSATLL
ncbi:MAG: hypothetical protein ACO1SX_15930, partial [Actinomycetota bacterium]